MFQWPLPDESTLERVMPVLGMPSAALAFTAEMKRIEERIGVVMGFVSV